MAKQRKRIVVDKVEKDYEEAWEKAEKGPLIAYNTYDVDTEIRQEYGQLDSIPCILRAILKELVKARLERG